MQTETHGVPLRVTDQGKDTQQPPGRRKRRWWIGIGIVVLLVIGANRDEPTAVTSQPATQPTTAPARPAPPADSPNALADAWADAREAFRRGSSTTASPAAGASPSAPAQPSRATPPPTATRAVAAAPTPAAPTPARPAPTPPAAPAPQPQPAPSSDCHSSYRGACVPIASDVDCAGGSGNGPAYARGPFEVVGPDVYGLDADKDGIACE